jgi:hypothetical protein
MLIKIAVCSFKESALEWVIQRLLDYKAFLITDLPPTESISVINKSAIDLNISLFVETRKSVKCGKSTFVGLR